jgi:hypothetical protein
MTGRTGMGRPGMTKSYDRFCSSWFKESHMDATTPKHRAAGRSASKAAPKSASSNAPPRGYPDLHDHIRALDAAGLLVTVDRPINKDTEMHPLVR